MSTVRELVVRLRLVEEEANAQGVSLVQLIEELRLMEEEALPVPSDMPAPNPLARGGVARVMIGLVESVVNDLPLEEGDTLAALQCLPLHMLADWPEPQNVDIGDAVGAAVRLQLGEQRAEDVATCVAYIRQTRPDFEEAVRSMVGVSGS